MSSSKPIPVHAAKTQLSKLIERALAGEDVVICRGSTPVVRLVPVGGVPARTPGAWLGRAALDAAFFEPLPTVELGAWEGE